MAVRAVRLACPTTPNWAKVELIYNRDDWNAWVLQRTRGSILQSFDWGEFKAGFGWQPLRMWVRDGAEVVGGGQVLLRQLPFGSVAYAPRGPLVNLDDPDATQAVFAALHQLASEAGAVFLKIEPEVAGSDILTGRLRSLGFRSADPIQPRSTLIVDLRPDLNILSARLDRKTRYNVGLATRKGVVLAEGGAADLPEFYKLMEETSRRGQFPIHSLEYYTALWESLESRGMVRLLFARHQGDNLAAAMVLRMGERAYYLYGASASQRRNLKPNDLLQWECLTRAKADGCISYDLWGIPDELGQMTSAGGAHDNPADTGLQGVYHFKRGFGGRSIRYLGAFDYVYSSPRYWLWLSLLPRIRRLAEWWALGDRA